MGQAHETLQSVQQPCAIAGFRVEHGCTWTHEPSNSRHVVGTYTDRSWKLYCYSVAYMQLVEAFAVSSWQSLCHHAEPLLIMIKHPQACIHSWGEYQACTVHPDLTAGKLAAVRNEQCVPSGRKPGTATPSVHSPVPPPSCWRIVVINQLGDHPINATVLRPIWPSRPHETPYP